MSAFNLEQFARQLIAETLLYDDEYEALGNLSLIDFENRKERFLASYVPDENVFIIEEATEWEEDEPSEGEDIGYALAVDSAPHGSFNSAEEAADALFQLAQQHGLMPSVTLLFEEDEVS